MAPKKKAGGKKKPADDDEYWDSLAAKKDSPAASGAVSDEEDAPAARPSAASKFSSFGGMDVDEPADEDDEEDGLMAQVAAAKKGGKKDKKKKKQVSYSDEEEENARLMAGESLEDIQAAPAPPPAAAKEAEEADPDAWMNDEFGDDKKKGKKGKKGKKAKKADSDDEFERALAAVTGGTAKVDIAADEPAAEADKVEEKAVEKASETVKDEGDDDAPKGVLSKKEKERLKKEKEKEKKKAQAAAKKAAAGNAPAPAPAPAPTPAAEASVTPSPAALAAAAADEDDEGDEAGGDASAKSKKKKKKKGGAAAAPAAEAEPAKPKKVSAQVERLRLMMEAQKAAQEEAERAEREERERIEAEERRVEEEEKAKEAARLAKKEKERLKKEQLKKEGKLLTPKQKAEKAAAERRKQALLASGALVVPALDKDDPSEPKPSYAKKKPFNRQAPAQANGSAPSSPALGAAPSKPASPEPAEPPKPVEADPDGDDDVKDDWDASSSEEEAPAKKDEKDDDVKDDWDASSSDEEAKKPAPAPAPVAKAKPTNGKATAAAAPSPAKGAKQPPAVQKSVPAKAPAAAKGKAAAPAPESSSEEEDDDSDSGSDDSDDESDSDDSDESSSEEEMTTAEKQAQRAKEAARARRLAKEKAALGARSKDDMRSPICVILGHVDTGKTKLLDKIRQTNVQEGEAGGITQQIGATFFPMEAIQSKTAILKEHDLPEYKLPGLLVIDTPGHESFTNLRSRGSSLCNIAILVVDIMHGLEPQTLESMRLLRDGKTPFIVALNKIDRLYGWNAIPNCGFRESLAAQNSSVQREFQDRLSKTILAFAEEGLNAAPYYENKNLGRVVSLVPTSAHTGEGVPDMLMLIIKLTQERMAESLMYISTLQCTVLEVKVIEGLGTTIDVVLSNGVLYEGDRIVVCGLNGPIVTQVRALLTPQPMKELRIKGQYVHHKSVKASLGIKIVAPELEKAIAGSRLLVVGEDDDEDELKEEVMSDLKNLQAAATATKGVFVQASTLGSLEALLEFLRTSKIPVAGINIGPVYKKDVMRCATASEKAPEFAVILCFDVAVDKDAEKAAAEYNIKIFRADIIYHLFDQFTAYNTKMIEERRQNAAADAVWPCRLKTIACFAKRDPIILGCDIVEGSLRVGTPLCVVKVDPATKEREVVSLGKVSSLEINHKVKDVVKRTEAGAGVAVKIEHASYESAKQYGRHFDDKDEIIAMISRKSIDTLKDFFREQVPKEDWVLIKKLKTELQIA